MKAFRSATLAAISILTIAGCAVTPKVEYSKIESPDNMNKKIFDTYALQKSIITIEASTTSDGTTIDPKTLTIKSVPAEYGAYKIGMTHADSWGVKTNLNISKIENTDLISEVGTEVSDQRVETIGKIGGALVSVISLAAAQTNEKAKDPNKESNADLTKPIEIDTSKIANLECKENPETNTFSSKACEITYADGVTITLESRPSDAQEIAKLNTKTSTNLLFYSACRKANVEVQIAGKKYNKTVKISDPDYFQAVGFPLKGKIKMHSECGASVTSEKDDGVKSNTDIAEALIAQGKAIKEAIDAAKKKNE